MKRTGKCPKCECTNIIADAKVIDRAHGNIQQELSIATFRNPGALFFKEKQETSVSAWVCSSCGYVEFYADHPSSIDLSEDQ